MRVCMSSFAKIDKLSIGPVFQELGNNYTDITISCQGYTREVNSHKLLLAYMSPMLAAMMKFFEQTQDLPVSDKPR